MNETFTISINESMLHTDIVVPNNATITILDDECKYFMHMYVYISSKSTFGIKKAAKKVESYLEVNT